MLLQSFNGAEVVSVSLSVILHFLRELARDNFNRFTGGFTTLST